MLNYFEREHSEPYSTPPLSEAQLLDLAFEEVQTLRNLLEDIKDSKSVFARVAERVLRETPRFSTRLRYRKQWEAAHG